MFKVCDCDIEASNNCGSCKVKFVNDDFVVCQGVCERSYHATVKCSGVKQDLLKTVVKSRNLKYVCNECSHAKFCHILKAIQMCNENVLSMQGKLEHVDALVSNFVGRLSVLEASVSDVTSVTGTNELEKRCDPIIEKLDEYMEKVESGLKVDNLRLMNHLDERAIEFKTAVEVGVRQCNTHYDDLSECVNEFSEKHDKVSGEVMQLIELTSASKEEMRNLTEQIEGSLSTPAACPVEHVNNEPLAWELSNTLESR